MDVRLYIRLQNDEVALQHDLCAVLQLHCLYLSTDHELVDLYRDCSRA